MKGGKQLKLKETAFPPLNLPWPITAPKKLALWIYKPHTNATLVSFGSSIYPRPFFFCFSYAFPRPHLSSFPLSPPGTSFVAFAWRFLIALFLIMNSVFCVAFGPNIGRRDGPWRLLTENASGPEILTKTFTAMAAVCIS